ncbi:transcription initiation factor IIE subunit beta [Peniophora sp. CONT]|nr:transcription initiation factor IIE subunit beta [Peniophora sp. CONT]
MSFQRDAANFRANALSTPGASHPPPVQPYTGPTQPFPAVKTEDGVPVGKKKKRPKPNEVYSQPADTGTGQNINTQLVYAIEYLKTKNGPARIEDISIVTNTPLDTNQALLDKFLKHERVEYDPKTKLYSYKHEYNIRNKAALLTEIQRETRRGGGFSVKIIKESWPSAPTALEELEKEGDVFITRTNKDGAMKMVYWNETKLRKGEEVASLEGAKNGTGFSVEKEFNDLWHALNVPNDVDLLRQLENEGLQAAASEAPTIKGPLGKKKKKSAPRQRQAKITNTHLKGTGIDLTKDYVAPGK